MDELSNNKSSNETERNFSGGLVVQLKEKLHVQAKQLRNLETYKCLCEERIKDLFPDHPFPISRLHIGIAPACVQENLMLKQKLAKLEQQSFKFSEAMHSPNSKKDNISHQYREIIENYPKMQKEKKELEESLRSEMQASEKQRTIIEVLKQALEINIQSLGLQGVSVEDFANFSNIKVGFEQGQKELGKAMVIIHEYQNQIENMKEGLKIARNECVELIKKNDRLSKECVEVSQKLGVAEEELGRLEEEKSNLIDFIEIQTKSDEKCKEEIKELKIALGDIEYQYKRVAKEGKVEREARGNAEEEIERVKEEWLRNERSLKESQQAFINLKLRIEEKDRKMQEKTEEIRSYQNKTHRLENEISILTENLTKLHDKEALSKVNLERISQENQETLRILSETQRNLQKFKEKSDYFELKHIDLQDSYENINLKCKDLSDKYINLKNHTEELNRELDIQRTMNKDSNVRESMLNSKILELEHNISEISLNLEDLHHSNQSLLDKLNRSEEEAKETRFKFQSLMQEYQKSQLDQEHFRNLLESERNSFSITLDDNNSLKLKIVNLNEVLRTSNDSYLDKSQKLQELEQDHSRLLQKFNDLHAELQTEKHEKLQQSQHLCSLILENTQVSQTLSTFSEYYNSTHPLLRQVLLFFNTKDLSGVLAEAEVLVNAKVSAVHQLELAEQRYEMEANRNQGMDQEVKGLKSKDLMQRSQIDNLSLEINYLRESLKSQVGNLQEEIVTLRAGLKNMHEENESIAEQYRKAVSDTSQFRYRLSSSEASVFALKEKSALMKNDRNCMTLLIKKIQKLVTSANHYRIINEILRIYSELEFCQLEKLRMSMQIRKPDETVDHNTLESLRDQVNVCENNIINYSTMIQNLENQLISDKSLTIT